MSRKGYCCCPNCTNIGVVSVSLWKRGGRPAMICAEHVRRLSGYHDENHVRRGVETDGFTYSMELETDSSDIKAKAELFDVDFLATRDITCDIEFKSPIYMNLKAPVKHAVTIERLINEGHMVIGEGCGTHFHVGHGTWITPITMRYLRRFYNSIFTPLSDEIMSDVEKSAKLFGRKPNRWCLPVTRHTTSGNLPGGQMPHEIMFNLQHEYTVEFRQCKFKNAEQYRQCMNFCKDVTNILIEEFIKHFMDTDYPRPEGIESPRKAYRKHLADTTAQKMVDIYKKYTENF